MFIKSFATIFLILFSQFIFTSRITMNKDATQEQKILGIILAWFLQAMILSTVVVLIYNIWS